MSTELDTDPAAEFLAREQNDLQELDEDFNLKSNHIGTVNGEINISEKENELIENEIHENGNGDIDDLTNNKFNNSSSPTRSLNNEQIKEEPEKLRKWREEQQRLLEEKDKEEIKRKDELREQAKKELEEWYTRYSEQLQKSKQNNRNAEKEWIAERDTETAGLEWEKIARMCDFNPKAARNTKDTSRMRSILLQLKQSPPATNILPS